jgi:putative tryptophan/tyrosine transport system substrate-binding protein
VRRREFIALIGSAAATWPLAARAQQGAKLPTIGFLGTLSEVQALPQVTAFRRGLSEVGFSEGRNIAIEFRWAEGRYERLPAMAADLVRRPVALILANAPPAALSAKATTATVPIVFVVGFDPVAAGLVASLSRPGGNATGITLISVVLGQKRLEILRELAPKASVVAMLANPISPDAVPEIGTVHAAGQSMGLELAMFNVSAANEFDAVFAAIAERRPDALLVGTDPLFVNRREDIVKGAARLRIPAIYPFREYAEAGGLISYGTSIFNAYRQAGIYAGRILKGDRPGDLPVMQPVVFELVINLKTARELGLEIPATLHARSDEVIE